MGASVQTTSHRAPERGPDALTRRRALAVGAVGLAAWAAGCARAPLSGGVSERLVIRTTLLAAARAQIGTTTLYDPAYQRLSYPGGDIPRARGVCTDVIVRAYRDAAGADLQALMHADMAAHFDAYPTRYGLDGPDPNIDHRRVVNIERYLERIGARLPTPQTPDAFEPGDIVSWRISGAEPHIGFVSDKVGERGRRLVIHNFSDGVREEDFLWVQPYEARFRPDWPLDL